MSNVSPQSRNLLRALMAAETNLSSTRDEAAVLMQNVQAGKPVSFGKKGTDFYVELIQDPRSPKGNPSYLLKGQTGLSSLDQFNVALKFGGIAQTSDPFAFAKLEKATTKILEAHAQSLADKAEAERLAIEQIAEQQRQERQKTLSMLLNECREHLGLTAAAPTVDMNEHNIKALAMESYKRGTKLAFAGLTPEGQPFTITYASDTSHGVQQILSTEATSHMTTLGRNGEIKEDTFLVLDTLKGAKIVGLGEGTHPVVSAQDAPNAQASSGASMMPRRSLLKPSI